MEVVFYERYKENIELRAQNKSQRFIAQSLRISRNRVNNVFKLADEKHLLESSAIDG